MLVAANAQITGRRQGRRLGVSSFVASATSLMELNLMELLRAAMVGGLFPGARESRYVQSHRDLKEFGSSSHFLSWLLGAWPVRMLRTLSDLFSFAAQLPFEPDCPPAPLRQDSSEAHELPSSPDTRKRVREEGWAEKA